MELKDRLEKSTYTVDPDAVAVAVVRRMLAVRAARLRPSARFIPLGH